MRRILWVAVLFSNSGAAGGGCGPGFSPPEPDTCGTPIVSSPATLDIGPGNETFKPWQDDDVVHFATGGQGASMLVLRLRLDAGVPACLAQSTSLTNAAGATIGYVPQPLATYASDAGPERLTAPLYVILSGGYVDRGERVIVTVTVGSKVVTRRMWVGEVGIADASLSPG